MNNAEVIEKLYRIHAGFVDYMNLLPDSTAKTLVKQSALQLSRTLGKLNEDLVCDVCKRDISPTDELAFHYKQARHVGCATRRK